MIRTEVTYSLLKSMAIVYSKNKKNIRSENNGYKYKTLHL